MQKDIAVNQYYIYVGRYIGQYVGRHIGQYVGRYIGDLLITGSHRIDRWYSDKFHESILIIKAYLKILINIDVKSILLQIPIGQKIEKFFLYFYNIYRSIYI